MGTKLERQQSKQIEFLGKTLEEKEQALKEKAAALKEMTRALRASEKLLVEPSSEDYPEGYALIVWTKA